jgi:hypothetical protein
MLVPNPAGKYSVSFRTELTPGTDGGFTIYIAPQLPADVPDANWLPSTGPGKPRAIVMRFYLPKPNVLDGSWIPRPMTTQTDLPNTNAARARGESLIYAASATTREATSAGAQRERPLWAGARL